MGRRNPFWPAQVTVLAAILLSLAVPARLTVGAWWLLPAVEAGLLMGMVVTTPAPPTDHDQRRRLVRIGLVSILSGANVLALFLLTELLVEGANVSGRSLLGGGAILWLSAVLLFAVWFWELDRGGPVRRILNRERNPDFLFPPMTHDDWSPDDWDPQISDYLYLSLNNAASFSPAESMPLTRRAKLLMSIQTLTSLTTMTVVLAYAINNLK